MNCTSFGLSPCIPPIQSTQAPPFETSRASPRMPNQAFVNTIFVPSVTANRATTSSSSGLAFTPLSALPASHILTNEAPTVSASSSLTFIPTSQMPHISSNPASMIPANQASRCVSTVPATYFPTSLGPHISWNVPTQTFTNLPVLNNQHPLNPDNLGMPPSTSWASPVHKTQPPVAPARLSAIQVPHAQGNLAGPRWTSPSRHAMRSSVSQVVTGMGTPTSSPIQPPHHRTRRFSSVLRNQTQAVFTNQVPPVHTVSHLASTSGSQHAFSYQRKLRAPAPHMCPFRPQMLPSKPEAP